MERRGWLASVILVCSYPAFSPSQGGSNPGMDPDDELAMPLLRAIRLDVTEEERPSGFPFDLPVVRDLGALSFSSPVTFFVGENGSGKSTLLEAIALAAGRPAIGSHDLERDDSLDHVRALAHRLTLVRSAPIHRGFFFRAEDFLGFGRRMKRLVDELEELARQHGPQILAQRAAVVARYGTNLDEVSHGEGFLRVFRSRLAPGGLYLLDEPDTPLSPIRQLALLAMLKEAVSEGSQFIIATHAPIVMAFPDATIYSFDDPPIRKIDWKAVPHVELTRRFLADPSGLFERL